MISHRIIQFLLLLLCLGCAPTIDHRESPPEDLIPREVMVDVIVDLKMMDAILTTKQKAKAKDIDATKYYLYNSVLDKYKISREQFERSHSFYQQDLKIMDGIYAEALTRLSKMKSSPERNE